jgi:hypothetical protein
MSEEVTEAPAPAGAPVVDVVEAVEVLRLAAQTMSRLGGRGWPAGRSRLDDGSDVGALVGLDKSLLGWIGRQFRYASNRVERRGVHAADIAAVQAARGIVERGGRSRGAVERLHPGSVAGDVRRVAAGQVLDSNTLVVVVAHLLRQVAPDPLTAVSVAGRLDRRGVDAAVVADILKRLADTAGWPVEAFGDGYRWTAAVGGR